MNWSAILNGVWWPDRDAAGVPCNSQVQSGGVGISDSTIPLDPSGGVITLMFEPMNVPDKMEIIHGPATGTKISTSGMTVANAGPFDNTYGTEPTNLIPTAPQMNATDQFIGVNKGTIPTRSSEYTIETGISNPLIAPYQQLVWWVYTTLDYQAFPYVTVRVTGTANTLWTYARYCE